MKKVLPFCLLAMAASAPAAITQFDLIGRAGTGLIAGNENAAVVGSPGSGGETGAGFSYDDVTNVLTINFSWTGLQGTPVGTFGSATGFHIHGTVSTPNPYLGDASVLHNISGNASASPTTHSYTVSNLATGSGSVTGTISGLTPTMVTDLMASRWYVNVHSGSNGGGEIRGNLVPVPEPAAALTGLMALGAFALRRRA